MRGKPHPRTAQYRSPRITPAGAGKTLWQWSIVRDTRDHPRRCGENSIATNPPPVSLGSPPQVRGKPSLRIGVSPLVRITPAGAGKTLRSLASVRSSQDHPRRCGENCPHPTSQKARLGSPPQVRGKLDSLSRNHVPTRITPAGAGKTKACSLSTNTAWDHPRRCGENPNSRIVRAQQSGSPPQVRGKLIEGIVKGILNRITPAGAGKTAQIPPAVRPSKDHPRRCGENYRPKNPDGR